MPNVNKKCSKALRAKTLNYTNNLFESCVREILGLKTESIEDLQMAMDFLRSSKLMAAHHHDIDGDDEVKKMHEVQGQVSELYQERIKQLSTKQLNEILKSHELEGGIRRAPKTIETILSELTRRTIFGDSDESEFISNNGEVYEHARESKSNRSKAPHKRNKAIKN